MTEQNEKVLFLDLKNNQKWTSEKSLSELTDKEKSQYNLKRQEKNEIVLDVEKKDDLPKVLEKLKLKSYSYKTFLSGSRGYHLHLFFKELEKYSKEDREKIRLNVIRFFGTDEKMRLDFQWISCSDKPHFKTGKTKTYLPEMSNEGELNLLEREFLVFSENVKQEKIQSFNEDFKDFHLKDKLFLWYANAEKLNNGMSKNDTLHKNIACALVSEGLDNAEIREIMTPILIKQGHDVNAFFGWVYKARRENLEYCKSELNIWIDKFDIPVEKYQMVMELGLDLNENKFCLNPVKKSFLSMFKMIDPNDKYLPAKIATFYHIIGQMLLKFPITINMLDIDMRFNFGLCVESGLGKSPISEVVRECAEKIDFKHNAVTSLHEEQLIGKKWTNKKTGEVRESKGYFRGDFMVKDDALSFINNPKFELARNYMLRNLDTYGKNLIVKSLTEDMDSGLSYLGNSSFLYFIQPSEKIAVGNLTSGLFRRSPILRINLTENEIQQIIGSRISTKYIVDSKEFGDFLSFCRFSSFLYRDINCDLENLINKEISKIIVKESLLKMLNITNQNNIIKFSYINAIIRGYQKAKKANKAGSRMELELIEEDVLNAINDYKIIYEAIKRFTQGNKYLDISDGNRVILDVLRENKAFSKERAMNQKDFWKKVSEKIDIPKATMMNHFYDMRKEEMISTKQGKYDADVWLN